MNELSDIEDVRSYIKDWNIKYPIDRWWREKYNIPFGSPQHLDQSFIYMRLDFEDDNLHMQIRKQVEEDNDKSGTKKKIPKYIKGKGNWLAAQEKFTKMTETDIDDIFDRLSADLDSLKTKVVKSKESGKETIRI